MAKLNEKKTEGPTRTVIHMASVKAKPAKAEPTIEIPITGCLSLTARVQRDGATRRAQIWVRTTKLNGPNGAEELPPELHDKIAALIEEYAKAQGKSVIQVGLTGVAYVGKGQSDMHGFDNAGFFSQFTRNTEIAKALKLTTYGAPAPQAGEDGGEETGDAKM